jgi:STELLO glycosyltransferases
VERILGASPIRFDSEIMNKWVVITSINGPQPRYSDYAKRGWKLVVVGDLKSPNHMFADWTSNSRYFLSAQMQAKMYPELSSAIGFNTYARKNLGYLYALSHGASVIWETDDDTFIREELPDPHVLFENSDRYMVSGDSKVFNPYIFFAPDSGLWPRGFPLKQVSLARFSNSDSIVVNRQNFQLGDVDLIQTLVNLEPDVDAIFRLVFGDTQLEFPYRNDLVLLGKGVVAPGNTQSTFWSTKRSFPYLYVPRYVDFRFCDILKSYIAQSELNMAYGGFLVDQLRNPHDYLDDFKSEVSCYLHSEKVIEIVTQPASASIIEIYRELIEADICVYQELEILSLFITELRKIGFEVAD